MLEDGIIRPSFPPWSSPIWIVPKKMDASGKTKWRLVIDYRKLNEKTVEDRYPLPNISDILDKLGKCIYFTTLDLASGFYQIEMDKKDIEKTAFTVENGHYEYIRMPFGLKNAPPTFQRIVDNVLQGLQGKCCLCYMDGVVIYSTSLQEHIQNLRLVFQRLKQANLKIQPDKSEFLHKELAFLGHVISDKGLKPNPDKIKAIKQFPIPKTEKEIKSFLGLLGYYRKFIPNFANITKPLTVCLRKGKNIVLDEEYISCFNKCKELLCKEPILQYPNFELPFNLTTDASNFAIGAVLSQGPIGSDLPICYASRTLSQTEQNYSTIEKELLSIVWACKYFRPYLYGKKFKIITDHKPLLWLMNLKEPNSKLVRWRLKLEEFNYEIIHKKGSLNSNADALSRIKINPPKMEINTISSSSSNDEPFLGFEDNEIPLQFNKCTFQPTISSSNSIIKPSNPNLLLYETDTPINEFKTQFIFKSHDQINKYKEDSLILFNNKKRITFYLPPNNLKLRNSCFEHIIQNHINNKTITAILCDIDHLKEFQNVLITSPSTPKSYKILKYKTLLQDIEDKEEQLVIIKQTHDKSIYRGTNENLLKLKRTFYFPNMKNIIQNYINKCETCNLCKYDRQNRQVKLEITETATKPLDIIHIDIFQIDGHKFLTIIDKFSKYGQAIHLLGYNNLTIVKILKNFMATHGVPNKIITDNGPEFTSKIFKELCKMHGITLHFTTPKNSTGNSPVERFHSTIIEIYRILKLTQNFSQNPDQLMTDVILTYNNTIHSSTKMTPFELKNGHYKAKEIFPEQLGNLPIHKYLQKEQENYSKLCKSIKENNIKQKSLVINRLNKNRISPIEIQTGNIVFEKVKPRNKDSPICNKHIVKRNNKVTITNDKNRRIHKNKIKRVFQVDDHQGSTHDNNGLQ